ncbi:MAG: hypothetical protein PGN29_17745 [Gordonia paraffinivorans]
MHTGWDAATDFGLELTQHGHEITRWEADLIEAALSGGPAEVERKRSTAVGRLFRRHFGQRECSCSACCYARP